MNDIALILRLALALVLLAAALGKLAGDHSLLDFGAATIESSLAVLLIVTLYPVVAAFITTTVFVAYLVRALMRPDERCHCFGARLPSTSPYWQRARNSILVACSLAYLVIATTIGRSVGLPTTPPVDIGLAVTMALSLIVLPWLFDWTVARESYLGSPLD